MGRRTQDDLDRILTHGIALVTAGESLRAAAKQVGCTPNTLQREAKRKGLTLARGRASAELRRNAPGEEIPIDQ